MVERAFIGTWEVTNCVLSSFERCTVTENDMNGIRFTLSKNGDVTWNVPEELKFVPLFRCETYEYHIKTGGMKKSTSVDLRFGAYAGQIFEFKVYGIKPKKRIILSSDDLCEMDCVHVEDPSEINSFKVPFTFLPALEDGYFSDLTIVAKNKRQFKVHSTILTLKGNEIKWDSDPPPFSNISEDSLGTILHFLYAECLPDELGENTVREIIGVATPYRCLEKLIESCEKYMKRTELRDQIINIVNDMHSCMDQIVDYINPAAGKYSSKEESIAANPPKLYYAIKQSFREEVVAIVKFVQLCDIFTKKKNNLSSMEQDEIMSLLKSKVPIYNQQFRKFLEGLKRIYRSMSLSQRIDVAFFIVPEIESTLSTIISLMGDVDVTLQQIIQGFGSAASKIPFKPEESLSSRLTRIIHRTEFNRLISVHENIKMILEALSHKKEQYNSMTTAQQVKVIAKNLDFFIKELPIFLIRLDEIVDVFDEKLELHEFKFFFKAETSKIAYILEKLKEHVGNSQEVMLHACELVQRDSFNQTLHSLDLLKSPTQSEQAATETNKKTNDASSSAYVGQGHHDLNLVKSLCLPPPIQDSELSKCALKLLDDQVDTDMEFEVICANAGSESKESPEGATSCVSGNTVIRAHRVIVAARCDWFRRALLSGMREAIDKKIIIHDTNATLFRIFLEYLYGGQLRKNDLSTEQLLELLLLSDRYEMDSLKQSCEYFLRSSIDAESALYILSIADQYNATILKKRCIRFISEHSDITESEEFCDLPISLQSEIFDMVWTHPKSGQVYFYNEPDAMSEEVYIFNSNASSQENLQSDKTSSKLETRIAQLRNIIGDVPPKSYLVELILAADYNLERAINFYYSDVSRS